MTDRDPEVNCVVDGRDTLGEGPCWSAAEARLYWLDIDGGRLGWLDPAGGAHGYWPLPYSFGALGTLAGGGLIAATEKGLARVDTSSGAVELVQAVDLGPGFRANDGKIDPAGRFWWSRMQSAGGRAPGSIFRTDPDGSTHLVLEGIHMPNTLASSPDGRTLYVTDSIPKVITAWRVALDGSLSSPHVFASGGDTPDGGAMDAQGYLWNAKWGGWRIVRYAPDGRVDRVIPMPVSQPTSLAFGGPDLATLYVTSARQRLGDADLEREPQAGGVFAFDPGVRGLKLPDYAGWARP
jgi:sugar lactone lactonase YvrE